MKIVFADAYYFIALLNSDDAANARASEFTLGFSGRYVTTSAVLMEVADALSRPASRLAVGKFIEDLSDNKAIEIVFVDETLFDAGLGLYLARPDKEWSLTDCISFVVMQRQGLTEALTGDKHFEQAGLIATLKERA